MPLRWPFRKKELIAGSGSGEEEDSRRTSLTSATDISTDAPTLQETDASPPFGIKVLVHRPDDQRDCIDIVGVHGLNGNREKTWRDPTTGLNWLSDDHCLQRDIPNARVMSFGYNSRTYFSRSDPDVQDFASELLVALQAHRRSPVERQRPIVFVCHSLGGLVFKQAVVKAHEQRGFHSHILKSIRGVVFFATPHRGSDLATWDRLGTALHKAATLGYKTNTKLAKDLKVNAEFLKRVSESFVCRAGELAIRSFYETEFIPGLNCRVVERGSATLGLPNELPIASSAHHRNICKFSSGSDPRYKAAILAISQVLLSSGEDEEDDDEAFTPQEQACMRELNSDYEHHLDQVDDPVPGTCEWVLSHVKWLHWVDDQDSALLWISADAGGGKSVIAKFLVDHLKNRRSLQKRPVVFYFFFKEGLEGQDNATAAASALLHQFCRYRRRFIRHIMPKYTSMATRAFSRFTNLWTLLMQTVNDLREDVVWVLDGLDECDRTSLDELVKALGVYANNTSGSRPQHHLKVLLLSRPHNSIQQRLQLGRTDSMEDSKQTPISRKTVRLRVEEETAAVGRDIARFVQHKLVELGQQDLLTDDLLDRLRSKLIHGADLTFLWISLVIQLVEDAGVDGISAADLESILNTTKLDDVYERLLSGTPQPLKTKKVLMIILAAVRPLSLKEMCVAAEVLQDHYIDKSATGAVGYEDSGLGDFKSASASQTHLPTRTRVKSSKHEELPLNAIVHTRRGDRKSVTKSGTIPEREGLYDFAGEKKSRTTVSSLKTLEMVLYKPFSNHLRRICGHFVRIRGSRIHLVHQTARQFLLGTGGQYPLVPSNMNDVLTLGGDSEGMAQESGHRAILQRNPMEKWRHSLHLDEANRYLLQICVDYIGLFRFDRLGRSEIRWTGRKATKYLKECRDDPARAFFKYASFHWTDHYRLLRPSLDFSFDYLLDPQQPLFNLWIFVHRSWDAEKNHERGPRDIPVAGDGGEVKRTTEYKDEEENAIKHAEGEEDKRGLQDVLDFFWLDFGVETEVYDEQYLEGARYWKVHHEQADGEFDSGDEEAEPDDAEGMDRLVKRLPDRVQYYRKQNRQQYRTTWGELSNPMSGNPSSSFRSGMPTSIAMAGVREPKRR